MKMLSDFILSCTLHSAYATFARVRRLALYFVLVVALSTPAFATVTVTTAPTSVKSGNTAEIAATVSSSLTVSSVYLWFNLAGSPEVEAGWNFIPMTLDSGTTYKGIIPIVPAGKLTWYVKATYSDGSTESSSTKTTTIEYQMDYGRYHDSKGVSGTTSSTYYDPTYGWVQNTSTGGSMSTNFYATAPNGSQWKAHGIGWARTQLYTGHIPKPAASGVAAVGGGVMSYPALYFWNIETETMPFIRTPRLDGGLGSFSFNAKALIANTGKIKVQITRKENPSDDDSDWIDVKEYELSTSGIYNLTNVINDLSVTYARIVRSGLNEGASGSTAYRTGFIGIDNIAASLPPPDVILKERLRRPGYPSLSEDVTVRCVVSNKYSHMPAMNKKVSVYYSLSSAVDATIEHGWYSTNMNYVCEVDGGSLFEGTIPAQPQTGYMHYYFRCDFEGYYYITKENSDIPTPKFFYNKTTTTPPGNAPPHLNYEVRAFRSRYGNVKLLQNINGGEPRYYDMSLTGHNEWQVTAPVPGASVSAAYFMGLQCYYDDATSFSPIAYFYGDKDQQQPFETPTGGRPERVHGPVTNDLPQITINVANEGYLLYRLNDSLEDSELSYTIKRGIYQDFNTWFGDRDYYTKSLYGSAIGIYEDPVDSWRNPLSYTPNDTIRLDFTGVPAETEYNNSEDLLGSTDWYRTGAMIGNDRITNNAAKDAVGAVYRNIHAKLKAQVGRLRNTGSVLAMPPGVGTVSARMRSAVEAGHFALYNSGSPWTYDNTTAAESQLNIKTVFKISSQNCAKTHSYASIVFNYQDENNYHEVRIIRADSASVSDNRINVEFWRRVNGVDVRAHKDARSWNTVIPNNEITFNLRVRRSAATSKRCVVTFYLKVGSTVLSNYVSAYGWTEASDNGTLYTGGKVGFASYDCAPRITSFQVYGGTSGQSYSATTGTGEDSFYATSSDWSFGGVDSTHSVGSTIAYRWYVDAADGYTLKRRIPKTVVNLYTAPRNGTESTPPAASQYTLVGSVPLESLELGYYSWDIHSWQDLFVDFRVADRDTDTGDGHIVIDDIVITPWRAYSRTPSIRSPISESGLSSYQWTTEDEQYDFCYTYPDNWLTLEAWAVTNRIGVGADAVESVMIRMDHTQANTNIAQAVVTPILTNGIGTVKFDFYVTTSSTSVSAQNGKVVYAIEYTSDGNLAGWDSVATIYTNYVGDSGFHSYEIGVNYHSDARARIRVLNETDRDVILWLDNLYVNDFPEATSDMWKVYNGCITDLGHGDNTRLFDIAGRTLYLNDSPSEGLAPRQEEELDDHLPYLQSPKVPEGIGEISFMYRTYDISEPGYIAIDVAADENLPDDQWHNLTNFVVNGTGYVKFEDPMIYQKTNFFVRIHTVTNGLYGRVCIDNVLVTEKARAQYDIAKVWIAPEQPMVSETNVAVYAEINREIQNPTGIRLFVSYVIGTNNWGYANWWHEAWSRKIEMYRVGVSSVFKTPNGLGLPSKPANSTVQYVVWGIHNAIPTDYTFDDVLFQKEFVNPSWYGSINYNEFNKESGFSPYYFIYSCAKGAVWINEVWSHRNSTEGGHEYVELAGRSGVDISGWKIVTYKKSETPQKTIVIPENTKIPNDESGWGFYVLGDPGTPNVDVSLETEVDERDFFYDKGYNPIGIELCRDTGITEQRIVVANADTDVKLGVLKEMGFSWLHLWKSSSEGGCSFSLLDSFTPEDEEDGVLVFTNDFVSVDGVSKTWTWGFATPTPGAINRGVDNIVNQTFAPVIVGPGFTLVSGIASSTPYGTQNGQMTEINVTVDSGASTSIVYVAKSWYKIVALTSNGTAIPDAVGKSSYTFNVSSMSENIDNAVTFGPKTAADYASESDANKRWSDQLLDWFRSRGWTEAQIEAGDGDAYTVQDEYLLNTSPVLKTTVESVTSEISHNADGIKLTLKLSRSDDGEPVTAAVNGAVSIYGKASLGDASWIKIGAAGIGSGAFSNTESVTTDTINSDTLGFNFFIWKLE